AGELAGADTREQDDHVEASREQTLGEGEGFIVDGQGEFAHGGRDKRVAALFGDELLHFGSASAFKREDSAACKSHGGHYSGRAGTLADIAGCYRYGVLTL